MREKLIELIGQVYFCSIEMLADHLIANGVVVNPVKVGDTVYALYSRREYKTRYGCRRRENTQIYTYDHLKWAKAQNAVEIREKKCTQSALKLLGRLVFATREEAEAAIGEGRYNGQA